MNLPYRLDLMARLGEYMLSNEPEWKEVCIKAGLVNGWFIPEFVERSIKNIADSFLQRPHLEAFTAAYELPQENEHPKKVGVVMAGNIPLVGFHDFLCVFLTGNQLMIKLSSKDNILLTHLVQKLCDWEPAIQNHVSFSEMLKSCDAYIATGSNNSARHFDYYFQKYPHIIRRNRTSVGIIDGNETNQELSELSDDIHQYFGLGCRNITHLYVPEGYDFVSAIEAFKKYNYFFEHNKYKNNYDYQLAIHLLNNKYYMSSGSLLLSESDSLFSPVSQLNYSFYKNSAELTPILESNSNIQCAVGHGFTPFGHSQMPCLTDFADGTDTMAFLKSL